MGLKRLLQLASRPNMLLRGMRTPWGKLRCDVVWLQPDGQPPLPVVYVTPYKFGLLWRGGWVARMGAVDPSDDVWFYYVTSAGRVVMDAPPAPLPPGVWDV